MQKLLLLIAQLASALRVIVRKANAAKDRAKTASAANAVRGIAMAVIAGSGEVSGLSANHKMRRKLRFLSKISL
jgi:hypothetical protein